jgi:hypothetical protein
VGSVVGLGVGLSVGGGVGLAVRPGVGGVTGLQIGLDVACAMRLGVRAGPCAVDPGQDLAPQSLSPAAKSTSEKERLGPSR